MTSKTEDKKFVLYTGDGKGNLVSFKESSQFHEAMKQHCAEMYDSFRKAMWKLHGLKEPKDENKD